MSGRAGKALSGVHLQQYKERCQRHPWYWEACEIEYIRREQVKQSKKAGRDIKVQTHVEPIITVDDEIEFARAIMAQPDVRWFFEDYVERQKSDPDAEPDGDVVSIMTLFVRWYFWKRGHLDVRHLMSGARAVVIQFLRGELPSIDGPEARAYALTLPGVRE